MPCKCVPARLISAFQTNKRPLGRPNITVIHSFINDIEKIISNIDPTGTFNSWTHITFDDKRWTDLVENLESKQAKWDDSDWKDEENNETPNWNRSPPSTPPSSNHSSESSPFIFNLDLSHHFEILEIAVTSCLKEVKTAYKKFARLLHPDTWKYYKPFTKEEGNEKFKYVSNVYEASIESDILI